MITNADITIFNKRVGADRREVLFITRVSGVFWYETKGQSASGISREESDHYVIRIPITATIESGRTYISEEQYKKLTDKEAEYYWTIQKGDYVVKEILKDDDMKEAKIFPDDIRRINHNVVTVTEYADNTVRGTLNTKHWRIGGA